MDVELRVAGLDEASMTSFAGLPNFITRKHVHFFAKILLAQSSEHKIPDSENKSGTYRFKQA